MITFLITYLIWIAAILLMSLAAAGFVLLPLGWQPGWLASVAGRSQTNLRLFAERSEELRESEQSGELQDDLHQQLQEELARSLLDDLPEKETQHEKKSWPPDDPKWLLAPSLLVPLLAIFLYADWGLDLGQMKDLRLTRGLQEAALAGEPVALEAAVARMERRLLRHPENVNGWNLLAQYQMSLGQFEEAEASFAHLAARFPGDVQMLESRVEAAYFAAGNQITDPVRLLLDELLFMHPGSIKGLEIVALDAVTSRRFGEAVQHLDRLLAIPELTGDRRTLLAGLRRRAASRIEKTEQQEAPPAAAEPRMTDTAEVTETAELLAAETAEEADAAETPAAEQPEQVPAAPTKPIHVLVRLHRSARAGPNEKVYVFAGPESGPPVAVRQLNAGDLPLAVTLDDSSSMLGQRLGDHARVRVTARLSRSGDAMPGPGDLQAESGLIDTGNPPNMTRLVIREGKRRKNTPATGRKRPGS